MFAAQKWRQSIMMTSKWPYSVVIEASTDFL